MPRRASAITPSTEGAHFLPPVVVSGAKCHFRHSSRRFSKGHSRHGLPRSSEDLDPISPVPSVIAAVPRLVTYASKHKSLEGGIGSPE